MSIVAYTPLDIPDFLALHPGFNLAAFDAWQDEAAAECESIYQQMYPANVNRSLDTGKQRYSRALRAHNEDYPWHRVQGKLAENRQYVANFDRRFPELLAYVMEYFPFDDLHCITFLNPRDAHPVFAHFDREYGDYGYRVYLRNEDPPDQPALFFLKPQRPLPTYPPGEIEFVKHDGVLLPKQWEASFDLPLVRHYARAKSRTQSWALNARLFPHGADRTYTNARLVMLPFGKINLDKQRALIGRSIDKYQDYVIR